MRTTITIACYLIPRIYLLATHLNDKTWQTLPVRYMRILKFKLRENNINFLEPMSAQTTHAPLTIHIIYDTVSSIALNMELGKIEELKFNILWPQVCIYCCIAGNFGGAYPSSVSLQLAEQSYPNVGPNHLLQFVTAQLVHLLPNHTPNIVCNTVYM